MKHRPQLLPIARLHEPVQPRTLFACQACRARRAKCDKKLPTCTSCVQRDLECEYAPVPARFRKAPDIQGGATECASSVPLFDGPILGIQLAAPEAPSSTSNQSHVSRDPHSFGSLLSGAYETEPNSSAPSSNSSLPTSTSLTPRFIRAGDYRNEGGPKGLADVPVIMPCMATLRERHQRSGEVGRARSARSVLIRLVEEYPTSNASRINPYISLSPSSSDPLSSPPAGTSSAPHRALFNDTDLLFHSEILRYGLYQFAQRAYGQFGDLHYYRAITRLQKDVMPSELQLIIALLCSPLSEYESFHHIPQVVIINLYRNHLRQNIVRFIEECSADALTVLFTTAEYCLGLGAYSESVLTITAAIRKLQVMRVHLIDQNPPPPPLPDSSFDATRLRNPLLIDHFRIVWWIAITRDAHNAVTFGLRPVVRLDEFQVVYPESRLTVPPPDFIAAASHDSSDMNTSPDYPTYFLPFFEYASTRINCALSRLLHLVAAARYHFRHDITRWLRYWRRACQALERWRATSQSLIKVTHGHTIPSLDADVPVAPRKLTNHELLDGQQYYMLLIYLHHLDGVLPTPPNVGCYASSSKPAFSDEAWDDLGEDQFRGTSDRDTDDDDYMYAGLTDTMAVQPNTSSSRSSGGKDHESGSGTTKVPGAILRICDQRCWEAVLDLRQYMSHSIGVVDSYYNTLLLSTLYGAGVVCIEVLHGRRQISNVAAGCTLAAAFLEEIVVLLTHSSEFNPSDLRVVASLQKLRDNPPATSCYYNLTLEHLL